MALLDQIYTRRFSPQLAFRREVYKVLCKDFFSRYVPSTATVLDVAAGYCEFINHIPAARKIAVDLNPDIKNHAGRDVEVVLTSSTRLETIADGSVDVGFVSNFFEHITKEEIVQTLAEIRRVLAQGGRLLILQPNIRYCYRDYWMFFDHITPIDDRSLTEILELNGFVIKEIRPRFLPYTCQTARIKSTLLLKLYLRLPWLHRFFGQQAFIYAQKP